MRTMEPPHSIERSTVSWLLAIAVLVTACSSTSKRPGDDAAAPVEDGGPDGGEVFYSIPGYSLDWILLEGNDSSVDYMDHEYANAVGVLPGGDPVVAGCFFNHAVFGEGEPNETVLHAVGMSDVFLARYNSQGELLWVVSGGGANFDYISGMKVLPDGRVVVVGSLWGPSDGQAILNNGMPDELSLPLRGDNAFVAMYDCEDGSLEWAKTLLYLTDPELPSGSSSCSGVDVLASGEIAVVAGFSASVSILPGQDDEIITLEPGMVGGVILAFSDDGDLSWRRLLTGNLLNYKFPLDLRARSDGGFHISGTYAGGVSFGGKYPTPVKTKGETGIFVASLDEEGSPKWLADLGFIGSAELPIFSLGSALASGNDEIVVSGRYSGEWRPTGEEGPVFASEEGASEGFVVSLSQDGEPVWWRSTRFECDPQSMDFCGDPNTELGSFVGAPDGSFFALGVTTDMWRWDDIAIGVGGDHVEMLAPEGHADPVIPNGFIAGFDSGGEIGWVTPAVWNLKTSPDEQGSYYPLAAAFDDGANMYIAGSTFRSSTFGYGALDEVVLETVGPGIALMRYSPLSSPD